MSPVAIVDDDYIDEEGAFYPALIEKNIMPRMTKRNLPMWCVSLKVRARMRIAMIVIFKRMYRRCALLGSL